MVYVINKSGKPLMPCSDRKARHLLKNKRAKIIKYEPFTIQLLFECEDKVQDITLGVDPASKQGGLSASGNSKELYSAEFELRTDVVRLISTRKQYRQDRRSRKTRYRKARFDNRKVEKGWLAPSIRSKIEAHKKVISEANKILPITKTIVEVASFDIQKIKKPQIEGKEYQQGEMHDWNAREYVLFRDGHQCQGKKGCRGKILITHHIESRQVGGDAPNNLITLCKECHTWHHAEVREDRIGFGFKRGQSFRHQAFMGIMRWKLYEELKEKYENVSLTYGYITKNTRIKNKLEKSHRTDALCISGNPLVKRSDEWYQIKQVRKKKRNLHEADPRKGMVGVRRSYNVKQIVRKEGKWCLRDKVELGNEIGFISGFTKNWVFVRDIKNNSLQQSPIYRQINPSKIKLINRNNNWIETICLMNERKI